MRHVTPLLLAASLLVAREASAQPKLTDEELANKKFMHRGTFTGNTGGGWARDDVELEAVYGVTNVDPKKLYEILRADPDTGAPLRGSLFSDDNNFRELRRSSGAEAFSIGFPVDEIPWDAERHRIREDNPHVWLAIEDDRFEVDPRRNRRVLSLGTDVMDDVYYDTKDYLLLDNKMTIRSRKRWDTPTEARRILIGLKRDGEVANGFKNVSKTDVRNDGASAEDLAALDEAMRTGLTSWNGSPQPAVPLKELYERLDARGVLPDSPTFKGVLQLEPRAVLRSVRSRYHLNEVALPDVQSIYKLGGERMRTLAAKSAAARAAGAVPAAKVDAALAFEKKVEAILDGSLVAERAAAKLREIDPAFVATKESIAPYLPDAPRLTAPTSVEDLVRREGELKKRRVVAETISDLYHEAARDLDDGSSESLRRVFTRALDRTVEDHAELYVEWKKSANTALGPKTTYDPFLPLHAADVSNASALAAYNAFGEAQEAAGVRKFRNFEPLDAAGFAALGAQLENEAARIWGRQIEAAGTAARGLWFDQARGFYVPSSRRTTSNFIIDTMDFTMAYTSDAWDGVPENERNAEHELDESKLVNAVLVNEAQIELLAGTEYTKRVRILGEAHERARTFMKWAGVAGVTSEGGYRALHESLRAMNGAALEAELAKLNAFAGQDGSRLERLDPETFRDAILPTLLTESVRDGATNKDVEAALAGAKFVLAEYQAMQAYVAKLKEEKVRDVLTDAGAPSSMGWAPTAGGKGELTLALLRVKEKPVAEVGLVDLLEGASNHSIKTASAIETNKNYAGKLAANERDWFKVTVAAGQTLSVAVKQPGVQLSLHRSNGNRLVPQSAASLSYKATSATTVYVRVYGVSATSQGAYTLEVR